MKVKVEKIETNRVCLQVEVENQHVQKAIEMAAKKVAKKVNIPGFRKGKAPKAVIERFVGTPAILEEAAEILIYPQYLNAVQESGIEPVDRPDVEIVELDADKDFIFKATVTVKPEVTLGEYKGLAVDKEVKTVSEEDVQAELDKLQQRYAKLQELGEEDTVQKGDMAEISFAGYIDGEAFEGGSAESFSLGIGSGSFIPGFEDQLIGAKLHEEREIHVTFPEDYQQEKLAGKPALFKVGIKGLKRKELSPLDDEFAKDVSEFETLAELKEDLSRKLTENFEKMAADMIKNQAVAKAVANATVEIPQVMIESQVDRMVEDMANRLERQGLNLEQYLMYTQSDMDQLKTQYLPHAERSVKSDLVLEAIAKAENITATEEEMEKQIGELAKAYKQTPENIKASLEASGQSHSLSYGIMMDKTVAFLVDSSVAAEPAAPAAE